MDGAQPVDLVLIGESSWLSAEKARSASNSARPRRIRVPGPAASMAASATPSCRPGFADEPQRPPSAGPVRKEAMRSISAPPDQESPL